MIGDSHGQGLVIMAMIDFKPGVEVFQVWEGLETVWVKEQVHFDW